MKKILSLLITFTISFGVLIACGTENTEPANDTEEQESQTKETSESEFPLTIEDAADNEVVIEEEPEKIVSAIPSNTEIVYALDAGENVVGVTENDTYPEEVQDIDTVGDMELDAEKILSLEPDLVLAHETNTPSASEALEQITNADIPVFIVEDAQSIDTTYDTIESIGEVVGKADEAQDVINEMKDGFQEIEEKTAEIDEDKQKSVFIEISPEPEIFTGGSNTFLEEVANTTHVTNVAEDQNGWIELDPEVIIELNPDTIITTYGDYIDNPVEQVLARDGWDEVTAIKNEDVEDIDADLLSRPGPRLVEGAKELANVVYPELFTE